MAKITLIKVKWDKKTTKTVLTNSASTGTCCNFEVNMLCIETVNIENAVFLFYYIL